jgi:hypothetical protein
MVKNNKIVSIPILDQLLTKNPLDKSGQIVNKHENSLTGTIIIDIPNTTVDEFEIYNKYVGYYPNLSIKYGSQV